MVCRYGAHSLACYEMNLQKLCYHLKRLLVPEMLVMWLTAMPVATSVRGGFLTEEISFVNEVLRVDILLANRYASHVSSPCVILLITNSFSGHVLLGRGVGMILTLWGRTFYDNRPMH